MPRRRRRLLVLACVVLLGIGVVVALTTTGGPAKEDASQTSPSPSAQADRGRPLIGPASGKALHVMSFNLRFAAARDSQPWSKRRPVTAELLRREQPTIIGTQEGLWRQLRDIDHDLPAHYEWIGEGRKGGSEDEYMAVYFDSRRLDPLEYDHFWLSDTSDVIGSNTWGADYIRMVTWVRFHDRTTGGELVVLNTHLDDESAYARDRAADLIRDRIEAFPPDVPVIVTGDFNIGAGDSRPFETLIDAGMADTWTAAKTRRSPVYHTWHGYRGLQPGGSRVDWILTRGAASVAAAGLNTFAVNGQYPSDHLPVQALFTLR